MRFDGGVVAAEALRGELRAASDAMGTHPPPFGPLVVAAWKGCEADLVDLIDPTTDDMLPRGESLGLAAVHWAGAVLSNALGRYEDALAQAEMGVQHPEDLGFFNWTLVELVEAGVRSGKYAPASDALARLAPITRASGSHWALGIEARSRALVSEGALAERPYREAIHRLGRTRIRPDLARAHLVYGEWLRREHRRLEAREELRTALEMFTMMGVDSFAGRAERELSATGERVRKRTAEARDELTAREAQIARLAGEGLCNADIGERLFISQHTVAYHLRKVFSKLGISSRNQLPRAGLETAARA